MSDGDQGRRAAAQQDDMLSSGAIRSSGSTAPATSQSHGTSLRRDIERDIDRAQDLQPAEGGEDSVGETRQAETREEERVLRAWFNVPIQLGEVTGPEGSCIVQDKWAFYNCVAAWVNLGPLGLASSVLTEHGTECRADYVAAALNERGRIVTIVWDLASNSGALYHPRGRVALEDSNVLLDKIADWVIEPSVRVRRMVLDGRLPEQFRDISKTDERAGWRRWLGPVDHLPIEELEEDAVPFLSTMDIFPAEVQLDWEANSMINSHGTWHPPKSELLPSQVTVSRDHEGKFRGMAPTGATQVRMNYCTVNQDAENGMWAQVQPFSVAGARAVMDAILYPMSRTNYRPVVLEIAPTWAPLPREVTMKRTQVIKFSQAEDIRVAFHLVQSVARANVEEQEPGTAQAEPSVTIIVTPQ